MHVHAARYLGRWTAVDVPEVSGVSVNFPCYHLLPLCTIQGLSFWIIVETPGLGDSGWIRLDVYSWLLVELTRTDPLLSQAGLGTFERAATPEPWDVLATAAFGDLGRTAPQCRLSKTTAIAGFGDAGVS